MPRNRKTSGQQKYTTQSQTAKILKFVDPRDTESDCDLSDATCDIASGPSGVSTENMAGTKGAVNTTEIERTLVNALKDHNHSPQGRL